MSNIVYLTVTGEQQGSISAGCGTSESTGNRWLGRAGMRMKYLHSHS